VLAINWQVKYRLHGECVREGCDLSSSHAQSPSVRLIVGLQLVVQQIHDEPNELSVSIYRVVQKSEATTFEGSDPCMPTSSKCPNVYDRFYEYGVNRCIQNITALK